MLCTHLGEGGTENPRIEVEVDFSLEAEVPALPRKGQLHKNCGISFFTPKCFTKKDRCCTYEIAAKLHVKKKEKHYLEKKLES
jgi:hypothetical protein